MTFKEFACSIISEGASHYVPVCWHTPTSSYKNIQAHWLRRKQKTKAFYKELNLSATHI